MNEDHWTRIEELSQVILSTALNLRIRSAKHESLYLPHHIAILEAATQALRLRQQAMTGTFDPANAPIS